MTPGLIAPPPDHAGVCYSELISRSAKMSADIPPTTCLML